MSEPLRVLQILTNLDRGGMETMTMNFYRRIDRDLVQFDFLLHREKEGDYEAEALSLGARVYRVPRQNPLSLGYWRALDTFFAKHPYRVVHAQLDCMSAEPLVAAARHGAVVRVAHSHNSRQDRDLKYPLKLICKRRIAREATDLFACGDEAGRWMFGGAPFRIVRNAVDVAAHAYNPARREAVRTELGIAPVAPVVGHVGRFAPAKNHTFLLDAFAALLRQKPDAVLLLVGDGELRASAQARVAELGIAGSVRFLGLRSDVPDLMQAMDVFCMPSFYEGLPLVLVEAQSSGLPCLISDSIPKDCDIVESFISRAALSDGGSAWASVLNRILSVACDRASGALAVRAAGFDVNEVSRQLQEFYLAGEWPGGLDR